MIGATNYENIIITLGNKILKILNLDVSRLFNGASIHGADLLKQINETEYTSFSVKDVFIVFLVEEDSSNYYVLREEDGTLSSLSSFKMMLKIYGNGAHEVSQRLLTSFKEEKVLQDLHDHNLYIKNLSFPKATYEPINNVIWTRCDLDINLQVRFNFPSYEDEEYFAEDEEVKGYNIEIDEVKNINHFKNNEEN